MVSPVSVCSLQCKTQAQKISDVHKISLQRHAKIKFKNSEDAVETTSGRKPVFSDEMEKELAEYLLFMEKRLFDLACKDVKNYLKS
jgi:phosphoribosyl-ATP pyrophosphohydrolase